MEKEKNIAPVKPLITKAEKSFLDLLAKVVAKKIISSLSLKKDGG